jgi:hypothetical protein
MINPTSRLDQLHLVPPGGDSGPWSRQVAIVAPVVAHGTQIFCHLHPGPMSSASRVSQLLRPADDLFEYGKFCLDFIRQCK